MRLILVSTFVLCGLLAPVTVAHAKSCNAHGCVINCPGDGCMCIYDHETKTCHCYCDGNPPQGAKGYSLDLSALDWKAARQQPTISDVLMKILHKDVIDCLDKRGGEVTISAKSATPADLSKQFSRFCP